MSQIGKSAAVRGDKMWVNHLVWIITPIHSQNGTENRTLERV